MSETINCVDKGAGLWVVASLLAFKGLVSLRVGKGLGLFHSAKSHETVIHHVSIGADDTPHFPTPSSCCSAVARLRGSRSADLTGRG